MLRVLGIEVMPSRLERWVRWLAPDPQPFVVDAADSIWADIGEHGLPLSDEVRDTFRLWAAPVGSSLLWLSSDAFHALGSERRAALVREQVARRRGDRPGVGRVPTVRAWRDVLDADRLRAEADGHRFVWWPELLEARAEAVLARLVAEARLASRHAEVPRSVWSACASVLPGAEALAGTWPPLDAPANCFSTVMAAAGDDPADVCENVAVFDAWLARRTRPAGGSGGLGTVLVWRVGGEAVHAAVELGGGWALEKPSQEWHAPRAVVRTSDLIRVTRARGQRLERHTLTG